jgi:ribonucleotide monophosphatase NagD (HAD superfamily)
VKKREPSKPSSSDACHTNNVDRLGREPLRQVDDVEVLAQGRVDANEGLDVRRTGPEEAEVVVVTDLDTDDDTPEMYRERAKYWLSRKLPMICANPDRVVEHGDKIIYCGGALGDLYAAMGGMVLMAGKPYQPIYEEAFRLAEQAAGRPLDKSRVLAIGDSVRTDATGAAQFGIDLLFVTGSIHAAELDAFGKPDPQAIADLVSPSRAHLAGFLPRLAW